MSDHVVMMTTVGGAEDADSIAAALVSERLAACVQSLPITSTYVWKGSVERAGEVLLLIKTRADKQAAVEARIKALHAYDTPEIIAAPITFGSAAYLSWIDETLATN